MIIMYETAAAHLVEEMKAGGDAGSLVVSAALLASCPSRMLAPSSRC